MEAEHASLSCIIIDACGDPIAQVAYRCALCRKICDSTTDAMLHYQVEHVDLFAYNMQQQQQQQQLLTQSQHQRQANMVARGVANLNSAHLAQQHGSTRQQYPSNAASSGSLLKRTASSNPTPGSLLKRPATGSGGGGGGASTSNSLLKRATNVMRAYQTTSNSTNSTGGSHSNRATSRRSNIGGAGSGSGSTPMSNDVIDTIHRPYTTTSASRAAKRYAASSSDEINQNQDINNATRSSSRNVAPRHVQRTNQYTANLKAKISAQKTAAASKEQQQQDHQDQQHNQQKQRQQQQQPQQHQQQLQQLQQQHSTQSTPLSSQGSSAAQLSQQQSDSDTPISSSGSSVAKIPTSTANDTTDSASMISTKQQSISSSQSPGSRDSSKSYSLRPRSSGKKSFRIS